MCLTFLMHNLKIYKIYNTQKILTVLFMIVLTHFFNCIIIIPDANISINNNYPNNYHFMQIVGLNPQTKIPWNWLEGVYKKPSLAFVHFQVA